MAAVARICITFVALLAWRRCDAAFQQQYFRVAPRDTRVHEGGEAVLECEISSLGGQVQWAKDGFALGFASVIPGYPRYSMLGDRRHGVYNLRIVNATLEDEAEYQCQVGPAERHRVIRANASLTVIAPPTGVELVGHAPGDKLEIREGTDVSLECRVRSARPAATVVWYRGDMQLKLDRREDNVIEIEAPNGSKKNTRYTTKSRIFLKPTPEDDYAEFTCEARHEALPRDLPMRTSVQLSVLYPPGAPYIEGYAETETVRRGQSLELVCRSRGGNPPAQLIWYKNGEQVRMAYRTAGRVSENVLSFVADASDNKARYRCEAKNIMISNTLKAEVDLTVYFAPAQVTISGPREARVGDAVPLTCATAPSNPPADVKWVVMGKAFRDATNATVMSPEGGWVTTSNITVLVEPNRRSIVTVCHGLNERLTENVVSTHTINVLYPPSAPIVSGYTPGSTLAAGTLQRLLCISSGGNPLATLTWYKNDKKIHSTTKATDKSVTAELSILTNVTDNMAQYRCEASNPATDIPLFETVTLSVHFAPEAVKVRADPTELRPGGGATLVCDAASSNPPAALSWWRDGIPVQGSPSISKPGLHGGTVSTIELKLNVSKEMNGAVYTCQAMNEALQRSVHDALALKVLYAPVFDATASEVSGAEDDALVVALRADGNPPDVSYTWTKDGLPVAHSSYSTGNDRIISEGSMLNITKLSRHDAGVYTCEAVNSQGAATINISVAVNYPATIKAVSQNVIVAPTDAAILWCTAEGNPLTEEHFTWKREDYKKFDSKTTTTFDAKNGTSYLHVENADRADVGNFKCVVDNGVGKAAAQDVMLVVKFAPEMLDAPNLVKFAANTGEVAQLTCTCNAAPAPTFTWTRNGGALPAHSGKYDASDAHADAVTHTSTLRVRRVAGADYGAYECSARNELGGGRLVVRLDVTSAPDVVTSLAVTNVTHNSATLQWVPGFDGGMQPSYRVRYRKLYEESYKYEDVTPPNATTFTILGLERATDYVFSVMAINEKGQSKYRPDDTKATTLNETPSSVQSSSEEYNSYSFPGIFIITGTIVGTALILLNVLVIGLCLHRRTNKRIRGLDENIALTELGELSATPTKLEETDNSQTVIVYVSIAAAILILTNIALIGCFLWRRRARLMKEQAGQSSKSATIEMYAPSSYNDTLTGETLSSVSDKSEYSEGEGEGEAHARAPTVPEVPLMPSRHVLAQTEAYLMDEPPLPPPVLDYPPPNYVPYDAAAHARTLPHAPRRRDPPHAHTLARSQGKQQYAPAPSPMPPLDGSYYNMSSERYLSYPPLINEYRHQNRLGETPTPPQQYASPPPNGVLVGGGGSPAHAAPSPPPTYLHDAIPMDRQSAGGTLRRQRLDKMAAVPPPDVTVLHATCNQKHNRSPQNPGGEKQPQSILKDPSRHKYPSYSQHGSPLSTSTPLTNTSSQILTVQNLASDANSMPQYGTIRKENKKNNVTIDESYNQRSETHVV